MRYEHIKVSGNNVLECTARYMLDLASDKVLQVELAALWYRYGTVSENICGPSGR